MASLRINLTRPREDHEEDEVLGEDFEHNDPWVFSPTGPPSPSTDLFLFYKIDFIQ
jgi:hypothetical protein